MNHDSHNSISVTAIPESPSGGQKEALPCLDEQWLDQNREERQAMRKIPHAGRTKEGLDNDRFEKRSGFRKTDRKKVCFSERKVIVRKRPGRFGSKATGNRSLRRRIFKNMLEAKQEERKADRNLIDATSQDGEPCEKPASSEKTPDNNNNSCGANNVKMSIHRFSRPTGKTTQNPMCFFINKGYFLVNSIQSILCLVVYNHFNGSNTIDFDLLYCKNKLPTHYAVVFNFLNEFRLAF